MLVTYSSREEVIVCNDSDEQQMLAEYFITDGGRDISDYDREITSDNRPFVKVRHCGVTSIE